MSITQLSGRELGNVIGHFNKYKENCAIAGLFIWENLTPEQMKEEFISWWNLSHKMFGEDCFINRPE